MPSSTFVLDAIKQPHGEHCSQINREVSEDNRLVSLLMAMILGPEGK